MLNLSIELNKLLDELPRFNRERDQNIRNYMFWTEVEKLAKKEREAAKKTMLQELPKQDTFEIETDNFNVKKTVSTSHSFDVEELGRLLADELDIGRPTIARLLARCNTKESQRTTITVGDPER